MGLSQNLTAPLTTINELNYKTGFGQVVLDERIARGNANDIHGSFLEPVETWREFTTDDASLAISFVDVIPVGMWEGRPPGRKLLPNRPIYETAAFQDQPQGTSASGMKRDDVNAAGRFLSSFETIKIKFGGCDQAGLAHAQETANPELDCFKNHFSDDPEKRRTFQFNRRHEKAHCLKNKDICFTVNALDLSSLTTGNGNLTHVYAYRPVTDIDLRKQIHDAIDEERLSGASAIPETVAEFELGVLQQDSSLERSLAAHRRNQMKTKQHGFLRRSRNYKEEREKLTKLLPSPCYANPSQLYALAQWRLRQIENNIWSPQPDAGPLSIMNPGNLSRMRTRTRTQADTRTHTHSHTRTHAHAHTHTHTHTYTHTHARTHTRT